MFLGGEKHPRGKMWSPSRQYFMLSRKEKQPKNSRYAKILEQNPLCLVSLVASCCPKNRVLHPSCLESVAPPFYVVVIQPTLNGVRLGIRLKK